MTTNGDMTPRQPDEDEPIEELAGDVLDLVDETVARITDAEVNEHLRKVLSQSGYTGTGHLTGLWQPHDIGIDLNCPLGSTAGTEHVADLMATAWANSRLSGERLQKAQETLEAARREAEGIVAAAREEADEALERAARMVRDAREQAERIISDARREAERIKMAAQDSQAGQARPRRIHVIDLGSATELTQVSAAYQFRHMSLAEHLLDCALPTAMGQEEADAIKAQVAGADLTQDALAAVQLSAPVRMPRLEVTGSCSIVAQTVSAVTTLFPVNDNVAALFSRAFYETLAGNHEIDEAICAARIAVLATCREARPTGDLESAISTLLSAVPSDRAVEQFCQDTRLAAVGSVDGTVQLWDATAITVLCMLDNLADEPGDLGALRADIGDAVSVLAGHELPDHEPSAGATAEAKSLLTPAQIATMFHVDPKTVTRWAKGGKLTSIRTLGPRRYRETEVRALLAGIPEEGSRDLLPSTPGNAAKDDRHDL